ncbi:helix-turn-helix transcriptional regulator [Vibrio quintilis]|uniref:Bacterial regulatory proteins, luxR family n=1 Tax=Vibrio quintilis TaxID=1117707 RepID=A0A1M7YZ97_9VIBR|nr:helix-turn-helix transcriptional regulator [Vibrio quintilis]SHO57914.1 Bacterial regulatory proteins, luxR family [Vibrio quintilis]
MEGISGSKQDKALAEMVRALGNTSFPETLSHFVSKLVRFDNLIVIVYHKNHNPEELYRESDNPLVYQRMQSHYLNAAYLLDPFYHVVRSGIQTGIHSIFDLAPDQFKHTSYFSEYYHDTTLIDEFALFARLGHETTLTACFGRDKTRGIPYSKAELQSLKSFEHVLSALCSQHWRDYQPQEGKNVVLPPVTDRLRAVLVNQHGISLSARQAEVALYILQGHSSLSISLNLGISKETVKVFRKQLYAKCNISSQAELFSLLMPVFSML